MYYRHWRSKLAFGSPHSVQNCLHANFSTQHLIPIANVKHYLQKFGIGVSLKRDKYSSFTKPWNFHISIHLHPPVEKTVLDKINARFLYPRIWTYNQYDFCISANCRNTVHLVVTYAPNIITEAQYKTLVETVVQHTFSWSTVNTDIVYHTYKYWNGSFSTPHLLTTNFGMVSTQKLNITHEVMFKNNMFIPLVCDHIESIYKKKVFVDTDAEKRFHKVFLEIWTTIVANFTMKLSLGDPDPTDIINIFEFGTTGCPQLRGYDLSTYSFSEPSELVPSVSFAYKNDLDTSRFSVFNPDSDLRFVSCGPNNYSRFAFFELVSVFDLVS